MRTYEKIYDSNFKFKCSVCGKYQSIFVVYDEHPFLGVVPKEDGQNAFCEDFGCNANRKGK